MKRGRKSNSHSFRKRPAKQKKKNQGKLKTFLYSFFVFVFIVLVACVGIGAGMYAAIVNEVNDMNVHELAVSRSSIVYYTDNDGNSYEAETLYADGNCIWVNTNEISDVMKDAIVSIEDERFFSHGGVDIKRTAGAVFGYIKEKLGMGIATYGGSTITQQVIKNITQEKDRTPIRKVKEMMRAVAIEQQLSKEEILTMYLNVIFLANNCYGVEAASNTYFNKPASELNLTEAALIAGITQRPSYYDPIRNPENALTKRNTVLSKMYELGKITEDEYNEATQTDLGLYLGDGSSRKNVYSYFIDAVVSDVIGDLQTQKGYTQAFATQQVFSGGLKIYATIDMNVQNAMEAVFEDSGNFSGGAANAQSAMVIIEPSTGEIKGIIGGKGEKTESRGLNRATQTTRQPGSSLKPLSVYTPAIEKRLITQSTTVVDEPISIKDWKPKNSYSGYKGSMTVKKAVEISANIPAIKILQDVGLKTSYDYITNKFHLSTIVQSDRDYSPLALGGLTNGVTVEDMAGAYAVFANDGKYIEPHTYTKVLDSANRVLLEKTPEQSQAISPASAYTMSQLLYSVINGSSGTGRAARLDNIKTYGKTGTSNNDYDKWFAGYTPYYTGVVWFGFDQQTSISNKGISSSVAVRLWKNVMSRIHDGLAEKDLPMNDNLVEVRVCSETGKRASSNCSSVREYFIKGEEPDVYCGESHWVEPEEPEIPEEPPNNPETVSPEEETPSGDEPGAEDDVINIGGQDEPQTPQRPAPNTGAENTSANNSEVYTIQ